MSGILPSSLLKRTSKTYGRRGQASSAQRRRPQHEREEDDVTSTSDSDSDSEVQSALLGKGMSERKSPHGAAVAVASASKGKGGSIAKVPELLMGKRSASAGGNASASGTKEKGDLTKRKGKAAAKEPEKEDDVEWDEERATVTRISRSGSSKRLLGAQDGGAAKESAGVMLVSPSPSKKTRLSPSNRTTNPPPSVSRSTTPKPSRSLSAKRRASTPSDVVTPSPSKAESAVEVVVEPDNSPQRKRVRARSTVTALPAPPPSAPAPAVPTIPSSPPRTPRAESTSFPESSRRSPAKDLSSVFEQFATKLAESDSQSSEATSSKGKGKATKSLMRSPSRIVASLGTKNEATPGSPSSLHRTNSFPTFTPSHIIASPRPLGPSGSLPLGPSGSLPLALPPSAPSSPKRNLSFVPRGAATGIKKTYGGGARSFRRDLDEEEFFGGANLSAPLPSSSHSASASASTSTSHRKFKLPPLPLPHREPPKISYAAARAAQDEDELLEASLGNDLKTVSQLRSKGESSRFLDEFEYLVEGLDEKGELSMRRASAIEVLRKLGEQEFARRLKASGFVERVYEVFRKAEAGEGDRVLDPALALLVASLVRDQRVAEPLLRVMVISNRAVVEESICDALVTLKEMMATSWVAEEIGGKVTGRGLTKSDAKFLISVREMLDKSELLVEGTLPATVESLCVLAISVISSFPPRAIFQPQLLICSTGALKSIVGTFLRQTQGLSGRITKFVGGLDLLPADNSISLALIEHSLRIFESCTQISPSESYPLLSPSSLAPSFVHLVLASHILASSAESTLVTASAALDCLLSALKLLVELSTNEEGWAIALCDVPVLVPTLVKVLVKARRAGSLREGLGSYREKGEEEQRTAEEDEEADTTIRFDVLCLTLGLLTNLVESVGGVKETLRDTLINTDCTEKRKCAGLCQCLDKKSALLVLTDLYLDPLSDSTNELNTSFVHGYSAILLGLVMLETPLNQEIVLRALEDHPEEMRKLVQAMEEFASLHEQSQAKGEEGERMSQSTMVEEVGEGEGEGEGGRGVAGRIRNMLRGVRGQWEVVA